MIKRRHVALVRRDLAAFPSVVLLGPRQVGKTTLAREIADSVPRSLYLDLEDPADLARLEDTSAYLDLHRDRLVILDEVQRMPGLFRALRGQIDARRREGRGSAHFLLLGSASGALLRQSAESLAGRVAYRELPAFDALETGPDLDRLWLRGGFPESFTAASDELSLRWRANFIRTYLERDLPQTGLRTPGETLRRFWTMLSHLQGWVFNAAELARSLGVSVPSVNRYTDTLVDMMLLRRLQPYHVNVGKRLIKSPRILVRDSGVVHALLNIRSLEDLLGHPVAGASWEGLVVENLVGAAPVGTDAFFYRTRSGAEIDLLLLLPGQEPWAVEVKRSSAPKVPRGFRIATADVGAAKKFIVYPGTDTYPLGDGITAIPLPALMERLIAKG
ncbi:MAG: ATP-binding protein [Gemmatimonadota bacterium]|nr:ATP-binding protein [Gemmatimonadota bacterium]MDE2866323.1 ATP-binding protein [Gemmatimonadota bacterium]MXV94635.1 ATP-binding protein [Gemmatimonadota bacterium]MYB05525.1 ATP-binding protein [Gemmatimonadota bacterium]MYE17304.1 ATP-binding protein [Gemmatimonadota bacterium]